MGSACFPDDPTSDVWGQTYRLRVIRARELRHWVGKTGRREVGLVELCEWGLFCNISATARNGIRITPINSDFASTGRPRC